MVSVVVAVEGSLDYALRVDLALCPLAGLELTAEDYHQTWCGLLQTAKLNHSHLLDIDDFGAFVSGFLVERLACY